MFEGQLIALCGIMPARVQIFEATSEECPYLQTIKTDEAWQGLETR